MKQLLIVFAGIFISAACAAQNKDELAIRDLLKAQVEAWNKGDIEAYMKGYWNSDSLLFIGKSGPKYGYTTTLKNYKKSYPDTATMGKLTFDILEIKRLSAIYFFVAGKWHLERTIGNIEGHFTLLVKKVKNQWVIISDHSS